MAAESTQGSRVLLVAAASAAAGSLITLAALRLRHARRQESASRSSSATDPFKLAQKAAKQNPFDPNPRTDYLSWDDYFMAVAFLSAQRSKDPNKQVGACIVDRNKVICGIGYNGFPRGCPDRQLPWAKKSASGDPLDTKYPYVCHAEMNAILNKNGASVAGARVYVTMFPCNECAKLMIQAGISEVVYHEAKDGGARARSDSTTTSAGFNRDQQYAASRRLLALAGVELRQHRFQQPVLLRLTNDAERPAVVERAAGSSSSSGGSSAGAAANGSLAGGAAAAEAAAVAPAVAAVLENANGSHKGAAAASAAADAANGAAAANGGPAPAKRRRRKQQRQPAGAPDAAALPQPQAISVPVQ